MRQAAAIKNFARAFRMMKAMQVQGIEWSDDYRRALKLATALGVSSPKGAG